MQDFGNIAGDRRGADTLDQAARATWDDRQSGIRVDGDRRPRATKDQEDGNGAGPLLPTRFSWRLGHCERSKLDPQDHSE